MPNTGYNGSNSETINAAASTSMGHRLVLRAGESPDEHSNSSGPASRELSYERGYLDSQFSAVSPKYVGHQMVLLPPTWKAQEPVVFCFAHFYEELTQSELLHFFDLSAELRIPNPRPISGQLLQLASLFHPLFYARVTSQFAGAEVQDTGRDFLRELQGCSLRVHPEATPGVPTVQYYLQSRLFLAGCTLSAAIIQDRFSTGSIESKLSHLWRASQHAKRLGLTDFNDLNLDDFVIRCDSDPLASSHAKLIEIKKNYGKSMASLLNGFVGKKQLLQSMALSHSDKARFGFIDNLRQQLGNNLSCIIAYGSSVTSQFYADYDLIVVVQDTELALRHLAGTSPSYRGKEINLGVYDAEDFLVYQALSGDNLDHNARCLYGEAEILIKPYADLMIRNFSFGFTRMRQLLGMASYLAQREARRDPADERSLYEYFIKIPMHIMKGVRSVAGKPIAKEYINAWTARELGYDLTSQFELIDTGRVSEAMANAYLATQGVLAVLNEEHQVFETVTRSEADLWKHLELPYRPAAAHERSKNDEYLLARTQ
jgi:hypothetical protein